MSEVEELVQTLLAFDRPGPRYTSYPPANHFHAGVGATDYEAALARVAARSDPQPVALYAHLPFCSRRCAYCGCHSFLGSGQKAADDYLDDLELEVSRVAANLGATRPATHLQWGGGTPNYFNPEQLSRCFAIFASRFSMVPEAELGVELDPASLTREQVTTLKRLGFNRISLGVQDLDPEVQRLIGRGQSAEETRAAFLACRAEGFASVHFDLVYGLPGQTRDSLAHTLERVIELGPDRLSLFGFAFLPRLRPNQQQIDPATVPEPKERAYLYADSVTRLTAAGYVRIGMDHFARPDDELARAQQEKRLHRNFQGYTILAAPDLLAFGISGISDLAGCYAQNEKSLAEYHRQLAVEGALPITRGFVLSQNDLVRRDVITALMCNLEVRFAEIEKNHPHVAPFVETFADEILHLDELLSPGLAKLDSQTLTLVPGAWPLVRIAAMAFDAYLSRGEAQKPRYSSVV